jgi:hypothetical protein
MLQQFTVSRLPTRAVVVAPPVAEPVFRAVMG